MRLNIEVSDQVRRISTDIEIKETTQYNSVAARRQRALVKWELEQREAKRLAEMSVPELKHRALLYELNDLEKSLDCSIGIVRMLSVFSAVSLLIAIIMAIAIDNPFGFIFFGVIVTLTILCHVILVGSDKDKIRKNFLERVILESEHPFDP